MAAKGLAQDQRFLRSGDFREEVAYSAARELLQQSVRPTALYVANCVMALRVMRAVADLGLRCPEDVSIASTDNIPGVRGLQPNLTRSEHPIAAMVNELVRLLMDRIRGNDASGRHIIVFPSALMLGEACAPFLAPSPTAETDA